jgi:hypothetical protein
MEAVPIEIDFDQLATTTSFQAQTELCRVTVPALGDPVYLTAVGNVSTSSGTAKAALFLGPPNTNILAGDVLDVTVVDVDTTTNHPNGTRFQLFARLEPNSGGDYCLFGLRAAGSGSCQAISYDDPVVGKNLVTLRAERR